MASTIDSIPRDLRNLRACLLCSLVKSEEQFEADGCDNCERALQMKGDAEKVEECTSANFDGLIAAMKPEESWVCKWQKTSRKARGIYAVSVSGTLSSAIVSELKAMGIRYKPIQLQQLLPKQRSEREERGREEEPGEFEADGCDNCERALQMKGDAEKVEECTSANFDGLIAAMKPEESWVCKWQKTSRKARGIYAVSVSGTLSSAIVSELKAMGIRYKPSMRETAEKA